MKPLIAAVSILLGAVAANAAFDPSVIHWDDGTPVLPRGLPPSAAGSVAFPAHKPGSQSFSALPSRRVRAVTLTCVKEAPAADGKIHLICQLPQGVVASKVNAAAPAAASDPKAGDNEVDTQSTIPQVPIKGGMDATPTSPPLITDDPGTPGDKIVEMTFVATGDFSKGERAYQLPAMEIAYGIGDKVEVSFQIPYLLIKSDDGAIRGFGDFTAGVKWRFYDNDEKGLWMAVSAGYTGPNVWNLHPELNGLADGPGGYLDVHPIIQKSIGKTKYGDIQLVGNVGYTQALDARNSNYAYGSMAVGVPVSDSMAVMGEVYTQQATRADADGNKTKLMIVNVGVVKTLDDTTTLCASVGRCGGHTLILFGIQKAFDTDPHPAEPEK